MQGGGAPDAGGATMKVLIFSPFQWLDELYRSTAVEAGYEAEAFDKLQDMTSAAFRDPDAVMIYAGIGYASAAFAIREMRMADVKNPLVVLLQADGDATAQAKARAAVLMVGADDVQSTEIDPRELIARLAAVASRGRYNDHQRIKLPGCVFDAESGDLLDGDGKRLGHLAPGEAAILIEIARRPEFTVTKEQLMDAIYGGADDEPAIKIIDVLVCKVRRKIVAVTGGLDVVETIWSRGFRFVPEGFRPALNPTRTRRALG